MNRIRNSLVMAVGGLACATAAPGQEAATALAPIMVESESDATLLQDGYVAESGRQATKLDAPIAAIPQAITTVTQDQIEDQKPRTLNEALGYAASANPNSYGGD